MKAWLVKFSIKCNYKEGVAQVEYEGVAYANTEGVVNENQEAWLMLLG